MAKAGELDLATVAALINDAYTKYDFMSGPRTSVEELPLEIGAGEMILAERAGRLVGTAMVRPSLEGDGMEGQSAYLRHADALYFGLAAVARTEQKSGIGRMLVARAEATALERGFRQILLGTLAEMGNVGYYQALGYRTLSREMFSAPHWSMTIDHWHHAMAKDLAPLIRTARQDEDACED